MQDSINIFNFIAGQKHLATISFLECKAVHGFMHALISCSTMHGLSKFIIVNNGGYALFTLNFHSRGSL